MPDENFVRDEDLHSPFWVYGSNKVEGGDNAYSECFESKAEAIGAYNSLAYRYKWISEVGEYEYRGKVVRDWMWYYWSKNENWGDVPDPGFGVPEEDIDLRFSYIPFVR